MPFELEFRIVQSVQQLEPLGGELSRYLHDGPLPSRRELGEIGASSSPRSSPESPRHRPEASRAREPLLGGGIGILVAITMYSCAAR
jgi:hypothetical protein